MKIENPMLSNLISNIKEVELIEGSLVSGKILEFLDNSILLDLKGKGKIIALIEGDLKSTVGSDVLFEVRSISNNEIYLTPIESQEDNNTFIPLNSVSKLLQELNISESKLSINLVNNFMKFNIPLSEDSLIKAFKTIEKLEQLLNLHYSDKVILLEDGNIKNFDGENIKKDSFNVGNVDIKYFLIGKDEDYIEYKNVKNLIEGFLTSGIKDNIEDSLPKLVSFFLKNDIRPSLNNIKSFVELNKDPLEFVKDFVDFFKDIIEVKEANEVKSKLFNIQNNQLMINKPIINNKADFNDIKKILQEIKSANDSKVDGVLDNIDNKLNFLKEINNNLSFLFFPINLNKEDISSLLTIIKDNKKKSKSEEKFNIFINVKTNYLGNIKVSCELTGNLINIRMNIREEDLEFFQSNEKQLIEKIRLIGYSLKKIDFIMENDFGLIDTLIINKNPIYILDLKV